MPFAIRPVVYREVRDSIRNGDIGLFRPRGFEGDVIAAATKTRYSHATLLGWAGDHPWRTLMFGETLEHADARAIDAASQVERWPGICDVYRVTTSDLPSRYWTKQYNGNAAWHFVCHAAGSKYGWRHIPRVFARRSLGLDVPAIPNSDDPQYPRDCSALVHAALRFADGPQIKEYDADVVPGDLANIPGVSYLFTLFATQGQVDAARFAETIADPTVGTM